jgi:hypothetical protein
MAEPQVVTADQLEPGLLEDFLCKVYPPRRSGFLNEHGAWWHRSKSNQLVIQMEGLVAGYCAVIPTQTWIAGQVRQALWWIDIMIAPEFRGRGLQSHFDRRVQEMSPLLLGFPNELAAKIHRKHGWGVREDMPIMLLPLWPRMVKLVRNTSGWKGMGLHAGALALSPLASIYRLFLASQRVDKITKLDHPAPELLSEIFYRTKSVEINTTWRDPSYFAWRYGAVPVPQEYCYYLAGDPASPTHYLIARHITQADGVRYSRILDVFGDFTDLAALRQLLLRAVQDAIAHGSSQITLFAANPGLKAVAQNLGFLISVPVGFCWLSDSPEIMDALAHENYWTIADSDNDAPE